MWTSWGEPAEQVEVMAKLSLWFPLSHHQTWAWGFSPPSSPRQLIPAHKNLPADPQSWNKNICLLCLGHFVLQQKLTGWVSRKILAIYPLAISSQWQDCDTRCNHFGIQEGDTRLCSVLNLPWECSRDLSHDAAPFCCPWCFGCSRSLQVEKERESTQSKRLDCFAPLGFLFFLTNCPM